MTLSERNAFFKAGIVFCAVCTLLITGASFLTIPLYQEIGSGHGIDHGLSSEESSRHPVNFLHALANRIAGNNYYAVHASLSFLAMFSLVCLFLIYNYFERTSSPEILYIAFFTLSFSFEIIRLVLPLHFVLNFPSIYIIAAVRILLFARCFGIFALFAAGICSAGLEVQKIRNVIFVLIIAAMIMTISMPIDILNWDTSFNVVNGYNKMFSMIELVVFFTTIISFLITARNRDSREYVYVAAGIMSALIGRNFLLGTDNWAGLIPGIILLIAGTYVLCSKLHKIHLWL